MEQNDRILPASAGSRLPAKAGLTLVLGFALLGASCSDETATKPAETPPREVRTQTVATGALPDVVAVSGTLAAEDQAVLGMKVAGRLATIDVDLGSRATQGQVLARLVPTDFELRVQQAQAALEQARSRLGLTPDVPIEKEGQVDPETTSVVKQARAVLVDARSRRDRAKTLFAQGLLPQADLDAAEAAYRVAESQDQGAREEVLNRQGILAQRRSELESARQQLADAVLTAPFDGAVRERQATPGQYVAAGQPIVTLVRMHPLRLKLAVPERAAAKVRLNQVVRVHVDGDAKVYAGTVARLSPAIDESTRTLMIEAEVPNRDSALRPGSFASCEIVTSADQPVVFVPKSSLVVFAGIEKVLTVEDGKAVEKRVRTGRRVEDRVEIVEGVKAGEQVVLEPGNLVGGQTVVVAR